jgi:hypothetical protein
MNLLHRKLFRRLVIKRLGFKPSSYQSKTSISFQTIQPGIGKIVAKEEMKKAAAEASTSPPITSTEPRVHYSNHSVNLDNSTDTDGSGADSFAEDTAEDNTKKEEEKKNAAPDTAPVVTENYSIRIQTFYSYSILIAVFVYLAVRL